MQPSFSSAAISAVRRMQARMIVRNVNHAGSNSIISGAQTVTNVAERLRNEYNLPQDATAVKEIQFASQNLQKLAADGSQIIKINPQAIIAARNNLIQVTGDYLENTVAAISEGRGLPRKIRPDDHEYASVAIQTHLPQYKPQSSSRADGHLAL